MKKVLISITVVLCVLFSVACFAACSSTGVWVRPEFSIDNQGYTVEFVTNMEKDFNFPIQGLKLDHDNFANERLVEFSWIIKNAQGNVVGWIESDGGYDLDKKGNLKYGYSPSTNNGVYGFNAQYITIVLKENTAVFDGMTMQTSHGKISKSNMDRNPYSATQRYMYYDEEKNMQVPMSGSGNFVCFNCELDLSDVEVNKEIESINISFNIPNLAV